MPFFLRKSPFATFIYVSPLTTCDIMYKRGMEKKSTFLLKLIKRPLKVELYLWMVISLYFYRFGDFLR